MITMPDMAYVSIFTDNDLTHITEDHFEIKLIARLLDQIYAVQPPMFPPRYDDALPQEYDYSQPHMSTDGARPSAPQFPEHLHSLLTHSQAQGMVIRQEFSTYKIQVSYDITIDDVLGINVNVQDILL